MSARVISSERSSALRSEQPAEFVKWRPSHLMEWAKFGTGHAQYNLALSGIPPVTSIAEIPGGPFVPETWGTNYSGHDALRAVIARMYQASPENILLAQGASQCNFLIAGTALSAGGTAIVEDPCYEPLLRSVEVWADQIIRLPRRPENGYQPDPDEFRRLLTPETRLVVLTNLHNPSHVALNPDRRTAIASSAEAAGVVVLSDEVYLRSIELDHSKHGFAHGLVSINSLGKTWGLDTLRIGWAVGPAQLIRRAYRLNNLLGVNQPFVTEDLAWRILSAKPAIEWLTGRLHTALDGRKYFDDFMHNTSSISCVLPDGGISAFIDLPRGTDDARFVERLIAEFDTAVFPGHFYGVPGSVRVSFGGDPSNTIEGLHRLSEAICTL